MPRDSRRRSPESSRRRRKERRDSRDQPAAPGPDSTMPGPMPGSMPEDDDQIPVETPQPRYESQSRSFPDYRPVDYPPQSHYPSQSFQQPYQSQPPSQYPHEPPQQYQQYPPSSSQQYSYQQYPSQQFETPQNQSYYQPSPRPQYQAQPQRVRPPGGHSSDSSSTSSSFLNISRRKRFTKYGNVFTTFFRAPSEAGSDRSSQRAHRKKKRTTFLSFNNSSSSSVDSDLAYGRGYIPRDHDSRASATGARHAPGAGSSQQQSRDPRRPRLVDPNHPAPPNRTKTDDEILEIGRQLSDIARKQNDADLRASGKGRPSQLVAAAAAVSSFRRSNTGDSQRNRGIGSSRPHGDDGDSEWEDASEDEGSSDDGGLAYGSGAPESRKSNSLAATAAGGAALAAGAAGLYGLSQQNGNRRHSSQVDPRLFGPQNSLRGLITPVPDDPRQQDANRHEPRQTPREEVPAPASSQRSSTRPDKRPMQHVYPVPTSDPNNFDYDRGSVSQTQSSSRPAPVPIQQPVPVAPVSSRVYEADSIADGTRRHETKHGRSKSDGRILAGTAAAGVAAAAVGAAVASGRGDSRDYRRDDRRDDRRYAPEASQPYDRDRRERDGRSYRDQKVRIVDDRDQPRAAPDDDPYNAGLSRRHTAPVETLKDYSYRLPQGDEIRVEYDRDRGLDRNRRQYSDVRERVPEDRSIAADQRQKSTPSEPPVESKQKDKQRVEPPEAPSAKAAVDPFQFQVDDFHTPPAEAPRRPLTPQVFTVEREPDFSGMPAFAQPPPAADIRLSRKDSFEIEQQIEEEHRKGSRARSRTPEPRRRHAYEEDEHAASSILDEAKHATAPVAAAAFASAIAVENARTRERQRSDVDSDGSRSRSAAARDAVLEDADRYYRESVIARKIAEDELRSRSASPNKDHSVIDKYQEEEQPNIVTIVPPPAMEEDEDEDPSKHGPFAAPNADVRIDNTIVPRELSRFRIPEGHLGDGRDPFWKSRDPSCERDRPLLNLVTPTPIATPTPERQARSADTSNEDRTSEAKSVQDVIIGPRGEIIHTPSTPKSVTWGENETKSFEPDSPDASPSDDGERGSKSRPKLSKGSGWGILAAALTGGSMLAHDDESKDRGEETSRSTVDEPRSHEYRTYADEEEPPVPGPKPASPIIADASPMPGSFGNDNEFAAVLAAGLQDTGFDPNIVIDDPTYRRRDSPPGSNGAFYHHPTAETVTDLGVYAEAPRDGPSSDAGFVIGEVDTPTQEQEPEDDWASTSKLSKKDRKKREKAAKRQSTEGDDVLQAWEDQIPQPTPGTPFNPAEEVSLDKLSKKERKKREKAASREVVVVQDEAPAEPQDDWASSQPAEPVDDEWAAPTSSKKKKGKKGKKSIDVIEEPEDKSVSVPVDAFDDLVKTAEPEQMTDDWDAPKKSKKKSKRDSAAWDSPSRPASEVSVGGSKKDRRKSSDYAEPDDYVNDRDGDPPDRGRHSFIDDRDVTSVVSDPASKYDRHERRSNGTRYDDDDTRSVTSFASAPDGRKSSKDAKRGKGLEKRSSGSFFGLFGRNGSDTKLDEKRKSDKDQSSFLDNAGTLGAGVGMAGAAAALGYAASRQNANDASLHEEPSAGPETRAVDYIDPEIVERVIKPAIDPQYGDLLPLPPSEPSSPKRDLSDDEQLPALPDSRPETPPEERNRLLQKPTHVRRRSALDTPIKSPSHTAIPLQLRLGQRSSPSSPGFFRSSPVASPEATAAPELATPKRPARPTSWDSSREIKPLYLLESSRQGSQVYDDEATLHLPELPPSETSGSSRQSPAPASEGKDVDQLTGGSLPLRLDTDQPAFTLPTYSGSQETTPKAELPRDPLSVDVHSALVDDAPLPVGEDGKTDDRSMVPNDELSELPPLPQSTSKSPGAEDEGSPYPVEPMSKDRSSYLLYSTPPSVKKGQHQRDQSPSGTPTKPVDVMRDIQEETAGEDAETRKSGIWHAVAGAAAGGLTAAGLWAAADKEGPKDGEDVVARDVEAEPAGDEWAAPTPSKKKKGKKGKKSSAMEELPTETPVEAAPEPPVDAVPEAPVDTVLPAAVEADPTEDLSEPKLSKKDKKKKKKAQSQALDDWAEPTEVPEVSKSVDVEEPAADPAPVDPFEPASVAPTEEQPIVDEFAPVSKKDKKKKKKAQAQAQADDWSGIPEVQDAPKSLDETDFSVAEPVSTPAAPDGLEIDDQKQTEEQPVVDDFAAPVSKKDKKKKKKSQAQAFDDWSEPQEATETPAVAETPSADAAGESSVPAVDDSLPAESQPVDDPAPAEALPSTDDFAPVSKKDKKKKKKSQAQAWDDWSEPQEAAESPAAEIASADVTGEPSAAAVDEPVSAENQPVEDPAPTDDFAPISKKDKKKKRKSQVSWDDPPLGESGEVSASLDAQAPATEDVKADARGINEEQVPVDDFAPLSKKDKKKKRKSQPVTWDDPPAEESQETPVSLDDTQLPAVEAAEADAPINTEEQAPVDDFAPISKKDKKKKKKSQGWDPEPDDTPKSLDIVETPVAEPASDMPAAGDVTPTESQPADPEDTFAPLSKKDKKKKRKSQLSSWDDAGAAEEAPKPVEDVDQSLAQTAVDAPAADTTTPAEPSEPDFAPVSKKDKKKKKKSQSSWDDFPADEPQEASKASEAPEQQVEDAATRDISLNTSNTPAQTEATEDDFAPVSKKDKKKKKGKKSSAWPDEEPSSGFVSAVQSTTASPKTEATSTEATSAQPDEMPLDPARTPVMPAITESSDLGTRTLEPSLGPAMLSGMTEESREDSESLSNWEDAQDTQPTELFHDSFDQHHNNDNLHVEGSIKDDASDVFFDADSQGGRETPDLLARSMDEFLGGDAEATPKVSAQVPQDQPTALDLALAEPKAEQPLEAVPWSEDTWAKPSKKSKKKGKKAEAAVPEPQPDDGATTPTATSPTPIPTTEPRTASDITETSAEPGATEPAALDLSATPDDEWSSAPTSKSSKKQKKKSKQKASAADPWDASDAAETSAPADQGSSTADEPAALQEPSTSGDAPAAEDLDFTSADKGKKKKKKNRKSIAFDVEGGEPADAPPPSTADALSTSPTLGAETTGNLNESAAGGPSDAEAHSSRSGDDGSLVPLAEPRGGEALAAAPDSGAADRAETTVDLTKPLDGAAPIDPAAPPDDAPQYGQDKAQGPQDDTSPEATQGRDAQAVEPVLTDSEQGVGAPQELPGPALADASLTSELPQTDRSLGETQDQVDTTDGPKNDDMAVSEALPARPDDEWQATTTTRKGKKDKKKKRQSLAFADEETPEAAPAIQDGPVTETAEPVLDDWASETIAKAGEAPKDDDIWSEAATTGKKGKKNKKKKGSSALAWDEGDSQAADESKSGQDAAPEEETAQPDAAPVDESVLTAVPAAEESVPASTAGAEDDEWAAPTTGKKAKKNKKNKKGSSAFAWDDTEASQTPEDSKAEPESVATEQSSQLAGATTTIEDSSAAPAAAEEPLPVVPAEAGEDEWATPTSGKKAKKGKKKKDTSALSWDEPEPSPAVEEQAPIEEALPSSEVNPEVVLDTNLEEPPATTPAEPADDSWGFATTSKKGKKNKKNKGLAAWEDAEPTPAELLASAPSQSEDTASHNAPTETISQHDAPLPAEEGSADPAAVSAEAPVPEEPSTAAEAGEDEWAMPTVGKKGKKNKKNKTAAAASDPWDEPQPSTETPAEPSDPVEASPAQEDDPFDMPGSKKSKKTKKKQSLLATSLDESASPSQEPSEELGEAAKPEPAVEDEWAFEPAGKKSKKDKKKRQSLAFADLGETPDSQATESLAAESQNEEAKAADPSQNQPAEVQDAPASDVPVVNIQEEAPPVSSGDIPEPATNNDADETATPVLEDEFPMTTKNSKKDKKKKKAAASFDEVTDSIPADVTPDVQDEAPAVPEAEPKPVEEEDFGFATKKSKKDKKKKKAAAFDDFQEQPVEAPQPSAPADNITEPAPTDAAPETPAETEVVPEVEAKPAEDDEFGFVSKKSKKDKKKKKAATFDDFQDQPDISQPPADDVPEPIATEDAPEPAPTDASPLPEPQDAALPEAEPKPAEEEDFGFVAKKSKKDKKKKKGLATEDPAWAVEAETNPVQDDQAAAPEQPVESAGTSGVDEPSAPSAEEEFAPVGKKDKKKKKKGLLVAALTSSLLGEADANASAEEPTRSLPVEESPDASAQDAPVAEAGVAEAEPAANAEDEFPITKKSKKDKRKKGKAAEPFEAEPDSQAEPAPEPSTEPAAIPESSFGQNASSSWADEVEESLDQDPAIGDTKDLPADNQIDSTVEAPAQPEATEPEEDFGFSSKKSKKDKKKKKGLSQSGINSPSDLTAPIDEPSLETAPVDTAPSTEPAADDWPEETFVSKKSKKDKKKKGSQLDDVATPAESPDPLEPIPEAPPAEPEAATIATTDTQPAVADEWPEDSFVAKKSKKDKKKKKSKLQDDFDTPSGAVTPADEALPKLVDDNMATANSDAPAEVAAPELPSESAAEPQDLPVAPTEPQQAETYTVEVDQPSALPEQATTEWPEETFVTKKSKKDKKKKRASQFEPELEPEPVSQNEARADAQELQQDPQVRDSSREAPLETADGGMPAEEAPVSTEDWDDFASTKKGKKKKKGKAVALADYDAEPAAPEPVPEAIVDDQAAMPEPPLEGNDSTHHDSAVAGAQAEQDFAAESTAPVPETQETPVADEWSDFTAKKTKKGKKKNKAIALDPEPAMESVDRPPGADALVASDRAMDVDTGDVPVNVEADQPAIPVEASSTPADEQTSAAVDEWADFNTKKGKKKKKGKAAVVEAEPEPEVAVAAAEPSSAPEPLSRDLDSAADAPVPAEPEAVAEADLAAADNIPSEAPADEWADFSTKKSKKKKKGKGVIVDEPEPSSESATPADPDTNVTPEQTEDITAAMDAPALPAEEPQAAVDDWADFTTTKKSKKGKKKSKMSAWDEPEPAQQEQSEPAPDSELPALQAADDSIPAVVETPQLAEPETAAPAPTEEQPTPAADDWPEFSTKKSKKDKKKKKAAQSLDGLDDGAAPAPTTESPQPVPDEAMTDAPAVTEETAAPVAVPFDAADEMPLDAPRSLDNDVVASADPQHQDTESSIPLDSSPTDAQPVADAQAEEKPEQADDSSDFFSVKKSKKDKKKKRGSQLQFEEPLPSQDEPALSVEAQDPQPASEAITEPANEPRDMADPADEPEETFVLKKSKKDKKKAKKQSSVAESEPPTPAESAVVDTSSAILDAPMAAEPEKLPQDDTTRPEVDQNVEAIPAIEDEWALPSKKKKGKKGKGSVSVDNSAPVSRALSPIREPDVTMADDLPREEAAVPSEALVEEVLPQPEPAVEDEWAPPTSSKKKKKGKKGMAFALDSPEPSSRALSPTRDMDALGDSVPGGEQQQAEPAQVVDTPMADAEPAAEDEWALPTSGKKKKKGKKGMAFASLESSEPPSRALSPTRETDAPGLPEANQQAEPSQITDTPIVDAEPAAEDEWALPSSSKKKKKGKKGKNTDAPEPEPAVETAPIDEPSQEPLPEPEAEMSEKVLEETVEPEPLPQEPAAQESTEAEAWGITPSKKSKKDKKRAKASANASRSMSPTLEDPQDVPALSAEPSAEVDAQPTPADNWDVPVSSKKSKKGKKGKPLALFESEQPAIEDDKKSSTPWGEIGAAAAVGTLAAAALAGSSNDNDNQVKEMASDDQSRDLPAASLEKDESLDAKSPYEATPDDNATGDVNQQGMYDDVWGEDTRGNEDMDDVWGGDTRGNDDFDDVWGDEPVETKSRVASDVEMLWGGSSTPKKTSTSPKSGKSVETPKPASKADKTDTPSRSPKGAAAAADATPKSAVGKKKKGKGKKRFEGKTPGGGDDLFDDPVLWEGSDKKHISEAASVEVERFWGPGEDDNDEAEQTAKVMEKNTIAEEEEPKPTPADKLKREEVDDIESPVLGSAVQEDSFISPAHVEEARERETQQLTTENTESMEIDQAIDRGFEAEQQRDLGAEASADNFDNFASPYSSPMMDFRRSKSRGLPPVQEESDDFMAQPAARSLDEQAPETPQPDRDSGFIGEVAPSVRRSNFVDPELRDSGVHLREHENTSRQAPPRSPEPSWPTTPSRSLQRADEAVSSTKPKLRRSPLSKGELRESPLTKTPKLREPGPYDITPEPQKSRHFTPEPTDKRSRYGEVGLSAGPAASSLSGRRSVSDHVARIQSPAPPDSASNRSLRRTTSNTSLTRQRTPEPLNISGRYSAASRPESPASGIFRGSSATPPLRRVDKRVSGDLRSLSQRSQVDLATPSPSPGPSAAFAGAAALGAAGLAAAAIASTNSSSKDKDGDASKTRGGFTTTTPVANEGRVRAKDMPDIYDGVGEGRIGSPRSPTRPHSMRRRQSMQVLDLESRVEQLTAENRLLAEAKAQAEAAHGQHSAGVLADRDAEIDQLKQSLEFLQKEVARLTEVNDGLNSANAQLASQHNERHRSLEAQHGDASRGSFGAFESSLGEKDAEISRLRGELEQAKEQIRAMQQQILNSKAGDSSFLKLRDVDHFDHRCQQLCSHVQQWVLRFSKFSDMRACRLTSEINDEKVIDRLDNAVLDGFDVDTYLGDRVKRRDIFMSMTMNMIWEFVFTRYLFGMDREQRQKLKSLEKLLTEVGPPQAVRQWRAVTLTLLSKRPSFREQRDLDTEAVVQAIFHTLSKVLPPPSNLEDQIQSQLRRVMREAVDLSVEMRTQRAEYMMLPPLQPTYDEEGELAETVTFNASLMNERSGDATLTNEDLEAKGAVVRVVLFPLVVKKGDDAGEGDDEIVVCPAQVLVQRSHDKRRSARLLTPSSDAGGALLGTPTPTNRSDISMVGGGPIYSPQQMRTPEAEYRGPSM